MISSIICFFVIMILTTCTAFRHAQSPFNSVDLSSLLLNCTHDIAHIDANFFHYQPPAARLWVINVRPGFNAAQVESWAGALSGSSLFIGQRVLVQSALPLRSLVDDLCPAISANEVPISMKLRFSEALQLCNSSSVQPVPHFIQLIVRAASSSISSIKDSLPSMLTTQVHDMSLSTPTISSVFSSVTLRVSSRFSALAARWLLLHPSILFIQIRPTFISLNNNAAWQLQSGIPLLQPVWQHGLRGEGQLLSVGDTGIHPNSCFFSPSSSREPVKATISSSSTANYCNILPNINLSTPSPHPKLHAYLRYTSTDFTDVESGHGTHVSGSACGNANSPDLSPFNGVAPASKIVFIDLDKDGQLIVPDDLNSDYFPCVYQSGARISSNSWGSDDNTYDLYASSVDSFVYAHDDLLVLVAAGNEGANGEYTVGTPATAKNILAIGAVTSAILTDCQHCIFNQNSISFVVDGTNNSFIPASFGADVCLMTSRIVSLYRPPVSEATACQSFASETCSRMPGQAVVLNRGTCTFFEKSQRAIACGASLVVIINVNDDNPLVMGGTGQVVNVPVFSVGRLFSATATTIQGPFFDTSSASKRIVAPFSSRGPTFDGRMKPDIVAPGTSIFSSNALDSPNSCTSAGTCPSSTAPANIASKSGTSMATPLVAGLAALFRQYLSEGYYPGGFKGSGHSVSPSAALMRALILGSSRSTLKSTESIRSMLPFAENETPTFAQGWGSPIAAEILPFANASAPFRSFSLKLFDRLSLTAQSSSFSAQFFVSRDSSPLTITLAWTDPPSLPSTENLGMLVNDLDLLIISPGGDRYMGNALWSIQLNPSSVRVAISDTSNNQEQVNVPNAVTGIWGIHVRASRMLTPSQQFSLVISGEGSFIPGNALDHCSSWCRGSCANSDTCKCSGAQWGASCDGTVLQIPITAGLGSYSEDVALVVQGWRYYSFTPSIFGSTLDIYLYSTEGDPDVFVSADDTSVPDALNFMLKDERCDSCGEVVPNEQCDSCNDDICKGGKGGCFSSNRVVTRRPIIVGVHASCCNPTSTFKIKFVAQSNFAIVVIIISLLLLSLLIFFVWRYRLRVASFIRRFASSWNRSTTRPRLPRFPFSNVFTNFRRRVSSNAASQFSRPQQVPTQPRPRRQGYNALENDVEDGIRMELQPALQPQGAQISIS